jgi:hypothetical protein
MSRCEKIYRKQFAPVWSPKLIKSKQLLLRSEREISNTAVNFSQPEIPPVHTQPIKNQPASSATGDARIFFTHFGALNVNFDNIIPWPPQTRIAAATISQQNFWRFAAIPIYWLRVAQLLKNS